jgi:uncharacterized membrane protein
MSLLLLFMVSCDAEVADSASADCADRESLSWDSFGHPFVLTYCTSCHSVNNTENRYGAPENVNLDRESDVADWAERIRIRVLEDETMPIGGGVYDDDQYLLDTYLACTLGK